MYQSGRKIKVNLGCGIHVIADADWINCDNSVLAKLRKTPLWIVVEWLIKKNLISNIYHNYPNVRIVDIRKKLPFEDNSVDYVYCSQVIEHLHLFDLIRFLSEVRRVLRPNGVIRILTPDLTKVVNLYLRGDIKTLQDNDHLESSLVSDHVNLIFYPRSWVSREKRTLLTKLMDAVPEQHKYIFDRQSLFDLLSTTGFRKIEEVSTEKSDFPNARQLDRYQEISLEVEASK